MGKCSDINFAEHLGVVDRRNGDNTRIPNHANVSHLIGRWTKGLILSGFGGQTNAFHYSPILRFSTRPIWKSVSDLAFIFFWLLGAGLCNFDSRSYSAVTVWSCADLQPPRRTKR